MSTIKELPAIVADCMDQWARDNREAHRNSERAAAWRYRCFTQLGHWPDRNVAAWRRVRDVIRVDRFRRVEDKPVPLWVQCIGWAAWAYLAAMVALAIGGTRLL